MTWRRSACSIILLLLSVALRPAHASEPFPFGSELMLDTGPLYGSKRLPMIEIEEDGTTTLDLWCASTKGQTTVGGSSITIVVEPADGTQCTPERQSGDQNLLTALSQVTAWRRDGDVIELSGATMLRFRLMTN